MCLMFTWLVEEVKGQREPTSEELRLLVPQLPLVPNLYSPSFHHSLEGRGTSAGAFRNQHVNVCPGEQEEPSEGGGVSYRQQESHLCQQMKLASVSPGGQESAAAAWFQEEPASCSAAQPGPGPNLPVSRTFRRNLRGALTGRSVSPQTSSSSSPAANTRSFQTPPGSAPGSPPTCQSSSSPPPSPSSPQRSRSRPPPPRCSPPKAAFPRKPSKSSRYAPPSHLPANTSS